MFEKLIFNLHAWSLQIVIFWEIYTCLFMPPVMLRKCIYTIFPCLIAHDIITLVQHHDVIFIYFYWWCDQLYYIKANWNGSFPSQISYITQFIICQMLRFVYSIKTENNSRQCLYWTNRPIIFTSRLAELFPVRHRVNLLINVSSYEQYRYCVNTYPSIFVSVASASRLVRHNDRSHIPLSSFQWLLHRAWCGNDRSHRF